MKRKSGKRTIALILCLALFALLALGSGSSSSGSSSGDKTISSVSTSDANASEPAADTSSAEDKATDSQAAIEEMVLFEGEGIRITATGMEDTWLGTALNVLIENDSEQNITVQSRNASVNGFMMDTTMSVDVAAGKKANDSLTFITSSLKECGIDSIATMEFSFYIFNSESWDEIVSTDIITVNTSIADGYVQTVDDSGEVLVDSNGIKIVGKGLAADDSFWGPSIVLYIENNSDQNITIQCRDVSVNGFMIQSSMSEEVTVGKKAISAVQFFSSDLEDNKIEDITDVELSFHIFNTESWNTIQDTDVISIHF